MIAILVKNKFTGPLNSYYDRLLLLSLNAEN